MAKHGSSNFIESNPECQTIRPQLENESKPMMVWLHNENLKILIEISSESIIFAVAG